MTLNRKKYPKGWRRISTRYRFEVAGGRCEQCSKKHGTYSPKGPDKHCEYPATRIVKVYINTAHRKRDPSRSSDDDLIALCPHCHAIYDMPDIQAKKHYGLDYKEAHQLTLFSPEP